MIIEFTDTFKFNKQTDNHILKSKFRHQKGLQIRISPDNDDQMVKAEQSNQPPMRNTEKL